MPRKSAVTHYRGGRIPESKHPVYQENTPQAEGAYDLVSLMCTTPMCREAWAVHIPDLGIFHKCSAHAWVERAVCAGSGGALVIVDPFEGVPMFRERGRRAWAYRLKGRDDRGDKLTKYQREKYRAALGL